MFSFQANKIYLILLRIFHIIRWFPKRLVRLLKHLFFAVQPRKYNWWPQAEQPRFYIKILFWFTELLVYLLDLLGLSESYETFNSILKINSRPLNEGEKLWADSVFGNSIPYERVEIDARAMLGPPWGRFAYVSGFIINSWGPIRPAIFIHELTHVWQYHQVGLVYIVRALWAQNSNYGYDYGGPAKIWEHMQRGELLESFNYEQQAEIVADYFRMLQNDQPEYDYGLPSQPAMYASILTSIKKGIG